MAKKEWSISLKREFYKDIFGIVLFPLLLTIFATVIFFIYLSPTVKTIKEGGEINYSDTVAEFYRDNTYNEEFADSTAKEDNILIVFLVNKEADQYYCVAKIGANVDAKINAMFGNSESDFGKIVLSTMDAEYLNSLSGDLKSIVEQINGKITALNLTSSFKTESDRTSLTESKIVNKSTLTVDTEAINSALEELTDKTGISTVIRVDDVESVFGRKTPTGNIVFLSFLVLIVIVSIYTIVKKVIARVRFEKNPQLFYKPTIYDSNDTENQ